MTQAQSRQLIHLQLTPMQLPEALPEETSLDNTSWGNVYGLETPHASRSLLLHPGEPSEIIVQIQNRSSHRLLLNLQIDGDFPPTWCRIGMEGTEIPPNQQMEAVLYFQMAADFFEPERVLALDQPRQLNYWGILKAFVRQPESGQHQAIEPATFYLYVRPHSLYLDFLPAIYRETDFVGRFLKIFEQGFEPAVQTLDNLWAYLNPLTAPRSLLPFLSHWVAWPLESHLSLERQRVLIRSAIDIYRWRGTRRGLRFFLHLATGLPLDEDISDEAEKPIGITESFCRGAVLGAAHLGEDAILGGGIPFHFLVHLRPEVNHPIDEDLVRHVIEQEKPAFCSYELYIEPRSIANVPALPAAIA